MANEITISKGNYSVIVYATNVAEGFANKIFLITPPQSAANQASGPKDVKVVDLLRITHTLAIKGFIVGTDSKTAHDVKADLKNIFNGADISGGTVTLTYDGDSYSGYFEKLTVTERSKDEPDDFVSSKENYDDIIKYEVAITFNKGIQV